MKATESIQWISGYWADATVRETTYLPPPPVTVEAGPNIAAPSVDYGWSPGCWIWYQGRYARFEGSAQINEERKQTETVVTTGKAGERSTAIVREPMNVSKFITRFVIKALCVLDAAV